MTEDELYLFDLNGYITIRDLLSPAEVARWNEAIDHQLETGEASLQERDEAHSLAGDSQTMQGTSQRKDLIGNLLAWDRPWCEPFREMISHPRLVPFFEAILGDKYRLDAGPTVMQTSPGAEGTTLHGGGAERTQMLTAYFFKNGRIFSGMIVLEVFLVDEGPDDGGVAVVPASHKANLPCPHRMNMWETHRQFVRKLPVKAGDAAIFTETLTHGALPWQADHERRIVLSKFTPRSMVHHGISEEATDPAILRQLTDVQRQTVAIPGMRQQF